MLVALRLFAPMAGYVAPGYGVAYLAVKSDSKAALGAAISLSSPSEAMNAIGREMAFDAATGDYQVTLFDHVPGVANKVPDCLSRVRRPPESGTAGPRPLSLVDAEQVKVPPRNDAWWRTRKMPPS